MKVWWRPLVSAILLVCISALPVEGAALLFLMLIPFLVAGYDVLYTAFRAVFRGQLFDENFLMTIATIGAFCIGEYKEAVFVMVFYQVGERFQSIAVGKSRHFIKTLLALKPACAHVEREGKTEDIPPESVKAGDVLLVRPGEKVSADGIVLSGESTLDMAALTGESLPRAAKIGDSVQSGSINIDGVLRIKAEKTYENSTAAKIIELVQSSAAAKAKPEAFITRFARVYTPIVVLLAALLCIVPPLFGGAFSDWLYRALSFLVVSCPCALVISVPLAYFGGIGGGARRGILIKGATYLESMAKAETIVFDKTGTLTKGAFGVTEIYAETMPESELLALAAAAEAHVNHPIAKSVCAAYEKEPPKAENIHVHIGEGVSAKVLGKEVLVGNARLMARMGIAVKKQRKDETDVHVAVDGIWRGYIKMQDTLKGDAAETIRLLRRAGVKRTVLLTGDGKETADMVGNALGIDEVHAKLMPTDKVSYMEEYLKKAKGTVVYAGDGINDAPVLARADVGIAMGALGTDAAIEAADVVIMDDAIMKVYEGIRLAKKTRRIVTENIFFAIGVKAVALLLSAFDITDMWMAVFADVGVSVLAVLNAMRMLGK